MDTYLLLAADADTGPVFTVDRWGEGLVTIAQAPPDTGGFVAAGLEARLQGGGWASHQWFAGGGMTAAVQFLPGAEYRFRDPKDTGAEVRVLTDLGVTTA